MNFTFRSDRLALDFAATLMFRESPGGGLELLSSPDRLRRWALASGVTTVVSEPPADALVNAVAVREAIYRIATAHVAGGRLARSDLAILNEWACRPPVGLALAADGRLRRSGTLSQVIATVARDAVDLVGGPDHGRIRQCRRDGCTRFFLDRTRGRSRIWCGMRECGNRVNAAAYRRRAAKNVEEAPRPSP